MSNELKKSDWLEERLADPDFRRYLEREEVVESFLERIEEEMKHRKMSKKKLADALGCGLSNLSQIMRRERNMTVGTMVDIAFHLGLRLKLDLRRQEESPAFWEESGLQLDCGSWQSGFDISLVVPAGSIYAKGFLSDDSARRLPCHHGKVFTSSTLERYVINPSDEQQVLEAAA